MVLMFATAAFTTIRHAGTLPRTLELLVIRRNHTTGELALDPLRWGLVPYWCQDPTGGRKPINAKSETVDRLPTFRDAYRERRCVVPVDGFSSGRRLRGKRPSSLMPLR